jgi:acetaldehyde dehydrogenase (acetylating)
MSVLKDDDLISIQEARELLRNAEKAFQTYTSFSQEKIDKIVEAMSKAGQQHARRLAEMAVEETGIGVVADKTTKNLFASVNVFESIRSVKTIGILNVDEKTQITEVGMPVGVICGIIPTTNPTSTVIFKSLIALKAGNAIVFSPHPTAKKCILAAANVMHEAAVAAGAPRNIIGCPQLPSMPGTKELMTHPITALILATGGAGMVQTAYSSGKPALGVGPGNVPAYIHQSADIVSAVKKIILSKTFDNGTVCSSEQAIVVDRIISKQVSDELVRQGAYFLSDSDAQKLATVLIADKGTIASHLVGRSADAIARTIPLSIPTGIKMLIVRPAGVGKDHPLSREKLSPVIAYYEVDGADAGCKLCLQLLALGGIGHSLAIHAQDQDVIREFALKKPVSRLLVNTPSTHGAIGLTTGLTPSLTLGCGSLGGNATSDNITARHLINVKRVARELVDPLSASIKASSAANENIHQVKMSELRSLIEKTLHQSGF